MLVSADGRTVDGAIIDLLSAGELSGQIAVSQSRPFVEIRTEAGTQTFGNLADGFATFVIVPIAAAVAIGRALINR